MTNYSCLSQQRDGVYVVTVLSTSPPMYDPYHRSPKCHGLYRADLGHIIVNQEASLWGFLGNTPVVSLQIFWLYKDKIDLVWKNTEKDLSESEKNCCIFPCIYNSVTK
jgi:hypothetical protein